MTKRRLRATANSPKTASSRDRSTPAVHQSPVRVDVNDTVYRRILKRISEGKVILFLGAGSTRNCRTADGTKRGLDGKELASAILSELNNGKDPGFESNLMEASEYWTFSGGGRITLDEFLQTRLAGLQATIGHLLASTFPWRAVVTTNFNRVVEDAWGSTHRLGCSAGELISIRSDDELRKHAPKADHIRLYKPHGCISLQEQQEHRMVLTSQDYYLSRTIRERMYDDIDALTRECTTLFAGYSLADYTFRNTFYKKHLEMKDFNHESFSVGPVSDPVRLEWQRESAKRMFNTTLINDCFDTFMLRLALKRGSLRPEMKRLVEEAWPSVESDNPPWTVEGLSLTQFQKLPEQ